MGVEIGQMIVKSNVLQRDETNRTVSQQEAEALRKAILDECRELIQESLQEAKER